MYWTFLSSSDGKESAYNEGDLGLIPGLECGSPLQYSCLENSMDREAWWATVQGVARVRHDLAITPPPINIYPKFLNNTKVLNTHTHTQKLHEVRYPQCVPSLRL